jgi:hypothetical protein
MKNKDEVNTRQNENQISENNKVILNGRIYPAIAACVNNRYKIILGLFAFYSFILTSQKKPVEDHYNEILSYGSIMFVIFIVHNCFNYCVNSGDQRKYENTNDSGCRICDFIKYNLMELLFMICSLILICGAYIKLLK